MPSRIVTQIEGFPSILTVFTIEEDSKEDALVIKAKPPPGTNDLVSYSITVTTEKIMRYLEREGIAVDAYEEQLFAMHNRHELVTRAIRNYISRNIIITNLEVENNKKATVKP